VQDHRWHVHVLTDAVAAEVSVDVVPIGRCVLFNNFPNLAEFDPRLTRINCLKHSFPCDSIQLLNLRMNISHHHHRRIISMKPILVTNNINVDEIAILQRVVGRYAVTNNLVDRGAHRLGKVHEVDGRRVRTISNDIVMHHFIYVVACSPYLDTFYGLSESPLSEVSC